MDLMLDIPSVLSCEIIGQWLYLKDLTRLDSAYCHTSKRQILHKSLFQAPQCVVENVIELAVWERKRSGWRNPSPFDKSTFKWNATRGLKVREIYVTAKSDCHVLKAYLQVHGHSVRRALRNDDEGETESCDAQLQVVTQCLPHLTSLVLRGGSVSQHAIQQIHLGTKLASFSGTEITVIESAVLTADLATPLQCTTILLSCDYDNSQGRIMTLCAPESVQRLSLRDEHYLDWRTFTNLRALQWQGYLDRHTALTIFSQCKNITHLNCPFKDDTALNVALTQLHRITSINLENNFLEALTDHALYQLALSHSNSLQAFYMYQVPHRVCSVSSAAINALLSRCTRLRTLSFNHVDGVNYSLLKSITTLTTDCPRPVAAWREIIHHCTSLETFHLMHTAQPIPVGAVMSINEQGGFKVDADQLHFNRYHSIQRDMQWSTHLIVIAARMLTTLKTIVYYRGDRPLCGDREVFRLGGQFMYLPGELRIALHKQAPTVLVVQGTGREWYNFSKLSIDD